MVRASFDEQDADVIVLRIVVGLVGAGVVAGTLLSAIRTVVLPRPSAARLSRLVFLATRAVFDLRSRRARSYEQRDRIMAMYAPVSLLLLPLAWLSLVMAGFALLFWAVGERPLSAALVASGSSLLTLGFERPDRLIGVLLAFLEAGLGVAVLALLLVTYLPSMYAAFSRREQAVTLQEARAGSPPSAVELLSRYARIKGLGDLDPVWHEWQGWFADVQETHTSLPALVFFRSQQPDQSWVTAAGALLDAASLYVAAVDHSRVTDEPRHDLGAPEAEVCIRAGYLALRRITDYFEIPYDPDPDPDDPISIAREEFDRACAEMEEAGVPLVSDLDQAWRDFAGWRVNYDAPLLGLAALTAAPYAPWSSDRSQIWRTRSLWRSLTLRQ
ncbi:MAG: hypothetical protein ABR592_11715 [Nitriliruptorales bacterium]